MSKRPYGLARLGADLPATLRKLEIEAAAREAMAVALWPEVVGEHFAAATRAAGIRGGVLEVRTRNSGWAQELSFYKGEILGRLNRRLGAQVVTDLRFRTGGVPPVAPGPPAASPAEAVALPVPEAVRREIEAKASHPDAEIAAFLAQTLTRAWQLDEWRRQQGHQACRACGTLCEPPGDLCPMCRRDARVSDTNHR